MVTDLPPSGVLPLTVPGDVVLVRRPGLVAWAGAVTAFPEGFEFTLLILFDASAGVPAGLDLDVTRFHHQTWLAVRFGDGRYREVTQSNLDKPFDQPQGPQLRMVHAFQDNSGRHIARWWVTPLPPPGPVELAVHLDGAAGSSGTAQLDGAALASAAARAQVLWPEASA